MWEGYNTQHVTSEPHIVRPWGRPDLMGTQGSPSSLPTPISIPTPCSQALQDASILPHWPQHSTALKGLLCETKGTLDKNRDCAFHRSTW